MSAHLTGENEDSVDTLNGKQWQSQSAAPVGAAPCRKQTEKLTEKMKELIAKCKNIKLLTAVDRIDLVEL